MEQPEQQIPETMNQELMDEPDTEEHEPKTQQEPLPQQIFCRNCNHYNLQLLSLILKDGVTLTLLCLFCGQVNDLVIELNKNKVELHNQERSYLG
jgi:transcription elongation factor Elf1